MGTASCQGHLANLWLVSACKQGPLPAAGPAGAAGLASVVPEGGSLLGGQLPVEGRQQAHTLTATGDTSLF